MLSKKFDKPLIVAVRPGNKTAFNLKEVEVDSFAPLGLGKFLVTEKDESVRLFGLIYAVEGRQRANLQHRDVRDILLALGKDLNALSIIGGGSLDMDFGKKVVRAWDESAQFGAAPKSLLEAALVLPGWERIIESH
ncbi:MAG TPA: hypothetical protein VJI32_04145 [Candidatus Nanoarchaeia archaeon]|nr:hypothetical protein [Candidatus Nanoarchaeia archaeon]